MKKVFTDWKFYAAVLAIFAATALNFVSSYLIARYFPDRLTVDDLLFRITPYVGWTQYLTDIANLFSAFLVLFYFVPKRLDKLVPGLWVYASAYALRSFLVLLTPLGGPLGNGMHYGISSIHQFGEFPSGHTALVMVSFLLINQKEAPTLKTLAFISLVVEIVSLILSRGHYSIDIVGGMLIAYFAYLQISKLQIKA